MYWQNSLLVLQNYASLAAQPLHRVARENILGGQG